MVKLLFEDNESTPSSVLLRHTMFGENIYFSGGSNKLYDKLTEIYEDGDIIFIFYDVSLDNDSTVKGYHNLLRTVSTEFDRVAIVPIICIEYVICSMLVHYDYVSSDDKRTTALLDCAIRNFDYGAILKVLGASASGKSLEQVYKLILSGANQKCLRNTVKGRNPLYSKFYTCDCDCESRFCRTNCCDKLQLKAERLYTKLPLYYIGKMPHKDYLSKLGITPNIVTLSQVEYNCSQLFKRVSNSMRLEAVEVNLRLESEYIERPSGVDSSSTLF